MSNFLICIIFDTHCPTQRESKMWHNCFVQGYQFTRRQLGAECVKACFLNVCPLIQFEHENLSSSPLYIARFLDSILVITINIRYAFNYATIKTVNCECSSRSCKLFSQADSFFNTYILEFFPRADFIFLSIDF